MDRTMEKKHLFTPAEKKEFLRILRKYAHIIELKSNIGPNLRRKNIAWNRIACEYNTSAIDPYPATSKQLRRLWMNLKQRQKLSLCKLEQDQSASEADFPNDSLADTEVDEETTTPFFVSVVNQDDSLKSQNASVTQEAEIFTTSDNGSQFNVHFIDEGEEQVKARPNSPQEVKENNITGVKSGILVREYQDRKRRYNELHQLQKRLLWEQIREAKAKANIAELELKQHQFLNDQ